MGVGGEVGSGRRGWGGIAKKRFFGAVWARATCRGYSG